MGHIIFTGPVDRLAALREEQKRIRRAIAAIRKQIFDGQCPLEGRDVIAAIRVVGPSTIHRRERKEIHLRRRKKPENADPRGAA